MTACSEKGIIIFWNEKEDIFIKTNKPSWYKIPENLVPDQNITFCLVANHILCIN